jgi:putative membrane protein insertion efficiency factor
MDYKKISTVSVVGVIRGYQIFISPLFTALGGRCIYKVSCSEYAIQAYQAYPFGKASVLSAKRIISCNPFTYSIKK